MANLCNLSLIFIFQFSVFLLVIFLAELAVGIAAYMSRQQLEHSIEDYFNKTIDEYPKNPDVKHTYDIIQSDVRVLLEYLSYFYYIFKKNIFS